MQTDAQILELIQAAYPTLTKAERATLGDQSIANTISVGLTQQVPTPIGYGDVMNALGPTAGAQVLGTLQTQATTLGNTSPIYWAMQLLSTASLDLSQTSTQSQIAALVTANVLTAAQEASLIALCTVPAPIPMSCVSDVLNANGY